MFVQRIEISNFNEKRREFARPRNARLALSTFLQRKKFADVNLPCRILEELVPHGILINTRDNFVY